MENGYGKERQFDGYPFDPSGEERERFARCVRNALVEYVLDGAQSIIRFGDGRRFTFPVPHGEALLKHVEIADVIAVQGTRKSINVTVCFPCKVPNAQWASDEFTTTVRVEFIPNDWIHPQHPYHHIGDAGIDLLYVQDAPSREPHGKETCDARHDGVPMETQEPSSVLRELATNRAAIALLLAGSFFFGAAIASSDIDVRTGVRTIRVQLQQLHDWINGNSSTDPASNQLPETEPTPIDRRDASRQ